jgi:hypothetical protein
MKKIIYLLLIAAPFASCKKDNDRAFDESPDARLSKALAAYQTQLSGAPNGWRAVISPAGGGAYGFYFKFNDSNRVKMVSDFDSASAVTVKESSYRLKALQQPSLIFDTYSYLHVLSDPTGGVNGGTDGAGLLSDFEFYFDSATADTIKLVGRVNGSKVTMIKATAAEATAYTTGQFNINLFRTNYGKILEYFKRLTIGTQVYEVNVNLNNRTVIFSWLENGNLQTFTSPFFFTITGIQLVTPFNTGTALIGEFKNINWAAATNTLDVTIGSTPAKITGAIAPIKVNLTSPYDWWNYSVAKGDYFYSITGFHKDGIDDFYNVTKIPGYNFMLFWARYNVSSGYYYDAFAGVLNGTTIVGSATFSPEPPPATSTIQSTFTSDGRIIFRLLGSFGPAASPLNSAALRAQITDASGYYLVKVGEADYDMVSAKDARSWISWFF